MPSRSTASLLAEVAAHPVLPLAHILPWGRSDAIPPIARVPANQSLVNALHASLITPPPKTLSPFRITQTSLLLSQLLGLSVPAPDPLLQAAKQMIPDQPTHVEEEEVGSHVTLEQALSLAASLQDTGSFTTVAITGALVRGAPHDYNYDLLAVPLSSNTLVPDVDAVLEAVDAAVSAHFNIPPSSSATTTQIHSHRIRVTLPDPLHIGVKIDIKLVSDARLEEAVLAYAALRAHDIAAGSPAQAALVGLLSDRPPAPSGRIPPPFNPYTWVLDANDDLVLGLQHPSSPGAPFLPNGIHRVLKT